MKRITQPTLLIAILAATASMLASAVPLPSAWDTLTLAVHGSGPDEHIALGMLGAIGSPESRALIESILKSGDIAAISSMAEGFLPEQCRMYLVDLGKTAGESGQNPNKLRILDAIARAATDDAARMLAEVADTFGLPAAGVAFGLLGNMGYVAEPYLIKTAEHGRSAWSRETAAWTLIRTRAPGALTAFRSALRDPDERVRLAGAVALSYVGDAQGNSQLEAGAQGSAASDSRIQALVSLALLGQASALDGLKTLATSPDEAVRGRTVWAIAWSGNRNLKEFAYQLGLDHQPALRSMLAEKLLDPGDQRDMAVFQEMITTGDEISQLIAAQRLLAVSITGRSEVIVDQALGSENQAARALAVKIVSGYPAMRPALARHLSSPDPEVQMAALSAITNLHQKERFADVASYLASKFVVVSAAAARALVAIDPAAAKPILQEGMASKTSYVRIHCAAMLLAAAEQAQPK